MVSQLLGLLGHVLMKVRLLSVARRLSVQCGDAALKGKMHVLECQLLVLRHAN